ncbi:MAG TPA: DPP IV N-terminal domain-containing protein [Gemmatimonadales bacterium]|jgi:dipeptidyl aminopeptidase/acylaminoacyl peptidase
MKCAFLLAFAIAPFAAASAGAQQPVTAADYARAEKFLGPGMNGLVIGGSVAPNWMPNDRDDRFWYRSTTAAGTQTYMVDPVKKTRTAVADTAGLPVTASAGRGGRGGGGGGRGGRGAGPMASKGEPLLLSPDRTRGAFVRDWNLWVHDMSSGAERQLTHDGVEDFGYATDNAGWAGGPDAMAVWSPDSKRLATQQQDERNVGKMYLVSTPTGGAFSANGRQGGHPVLRQVPFPLPGDSVVTMMYRVIVDADNGNVLRLKMPADFHRGTREDNIELSDTKWSPDGSQLAIASMSRDNKHVWISVANASTGDVRHVLDETEKTQYKAPTGWQVLWSTNEIIWYSDRDDWGQLYLYDLATGQLKNRITSGDGPVMQILRVDPAIRTLWFAANGKEAEQDPYFSHIYRVNLDGTHQTSLTPDVGTHTAEISPDGKYVVDTYSQPDVPPEVALRNGTDGHLILPLEKADISKLLASGWKPPIPVRMIAHDGKTAIYGMMFVPTHLDSTKKYPIVNNIYPGPQSGSVGSRAFTAVRGDRQALAELGFVVVTIDGMGNPGRSKSFQDSYYGAIGRDNTLPDQVTGMKQLADRYKFIDLDRVGIWGHSGGGFATADAMFRYPEFFKVGIAESGNHDNRQNEDDWGERYQGLVVRNADGTDSYTAEANENFAQNLTGHLLLAHGSMDTNVPPYSTFLVVDALIKANKDFDLLILPNNNHGYTASQYMMRKRWDYFVRWLLNTDPPKEFTFGAAN